MRKLFQQAQGMVEYAFILVLVAIVIVLIIASLGSGVGNLYQSVVDSF